MTSFWMGFGTMTTPFGTSVISLLLITAPDLESLAKTKQSSGRFKPLGKVFGIEHLRELEDWESI